MCIFLLGKNKILVIGCKLWLICIVVYIKWRWNLCLFIFKIMLFMRFYFIELYSDKKVFWLEIKYGLV